MNTTPLSLQSVVDVAAKFLNTFPNEVRIEIQDLLQKEVLISGDESQMYDIFLYLYKCMNLISITEKWRFTFIMHEVRRLKDMVFVLGKPQENKYVAFSLFAHNSGDAVVDRFLRISADHLGAQWEADSGYTYLFPSISCVVTCENGMTIMAERGSIFTVYFLKG